MHTHTQPKNYNDNKDNDSSLRVWQEYKRAYFLTGITLFGIGAGGIKANISPLGAQQVEWIGEDAVHSFFNWFYWSVNIGGCIAFLAVVYVQQEIGFDVGYAISTGTLLAGLLVFLLPRNFYREHAHGIRHHFVY